MYCKYIATGFASHTAIYYIFNVNRGAQVPLDRTEWGWHLVNGKLTPTLNEIHPALQQLVEILSCNRHVLRINVLEK